MMVVRVRCAAPLQISIESVTRTLSRRRDGMMSMEQVSTHGKDNAVRDMSGVP